MDGYVLTHVLYAFVFGGAFLLSYALNFFLIKIARRFNFLDYPRGRKAHKSPTPYLGGAGIFAAFWFILAAGISAAYFFSLQYSVPDSMARVLAQVFRLTPRIFGIFLGGFAIWLVGFLDDCLGLSPLKKLIGQAAAALILMGWGFAISLVSGLGAAGFFATFVWILLMINAFNFIDSLDGHCAGVAFISCVIFFCIARITGQPLVGFFLITFAGTLAGFWAHNFKPAKIFLGDNGSLFIGYVMAACTLLGKYQTPKATYATAFIPVLVFGVPIYDTVSVILVRLARGVRPWEGDRNHFAHRLVKIGMSERVAVVFSYFIALTLGLAAVLMTQVTWLGAVLIGFIFVSILALVAVLEFYTMLVAGRHELSGKEWPAAERRAESRRW